MLADPMDDGGSTIERKYRRRLAIVLFFAVTCFALITWLIFNPQITTRLGKSQIFAFTVVPLSLLTVYFLYRVRGKLTEWRLQQLCWRGLFY